MITHEREPIAGPQNWQGMAKQRLACIRPPRTLLYRVLERYSMRTYGEVLEPGRALAHNSRVIFADLRFERAVAKFNKLEPVLKELAVMAAAAQIGCSWCMDFGYWEAHKLGIAQEKLRAVPAWRQHREL